MKNKVSFDPKVDYYKILLLNQDASDEAIDIAGNMYFEARNKKIEDAQNKLILAIQSKDQQAIDIAIAEEKKLKEEYEKDEYKAYEKAIAVLTFCRAEYDEARAKYLKSIESIPVIDPADYPEFDITKDYYNILDVEKNASFEAIKSAYSEKSTNVKNDKVMSTDAKKDHLDILLEAFIVLGNEQLRKDYDKARAEYLKSQSSKKGVRVIDEEEADEEKTHKAKFIIGLLTTAVLVGIVCWGIGRCWDDIASKFKDNKKPVIEYDDPNYTEEDKDVIVDDEPETEVDDTIDTKVNYYGDINDEKLVTERATVLAEQLKQNNVINIATDLPYTEEEIKAIFNYTFGQGTVNEAQSLLNNNRNDYMTNTLNHVSNQNDVYLNYLVSCANSPLLLQAVNMNGVDWEDIKENDPSYYQSLQMDLNALTELQKTTPKINYVNSMLFGDVSEDTYAFLQMLDERRNTMLYSTDQAVIDECYLDTMYSLTCLASNKDYIFTWQGKTYTVSSSNFINIENTIPGNILIFETLQICSLDTKLNVGETLDNGNVRYSGYDEASGTSYFFTQVKADNGDHDYFEIHDKSITIDDANNVVIYNANAVKEQFNINCLFDNSDLIVSDDGFILVPRDAYSKNLFALVQINTNNKVAGWYLNELHTLTNVGSNLSLSKENNN